MRIGILSLSILILAILALGVLVYFICYRVVINRKIARQESEAHAPMASTETMLKVVVIIGVVVMYGSLSSKITILQNELNYTRNSLMQENEQLSYDLESVRQQLKQNASMISSISYEFGAFNVEEYSAEMKFFAAPKSFSKETEITMRFRGENVVFVNNGDGTFSASVSVPLFEENYDEVVLCITEGGVTKTEVWEDAPTGSLCHDYKSPISILFIQESSFAYNKKEKGKVEVQSNVTINSTRKSVAGFKDLKLYVKTGATVLDEFVMTDGYVSFKENYEVKDGKGLTFFVRGEDAYGFTHEFVVTNWVNQESSVHIMAEDGSVYQVYTPDGTILIK